MPLHEKRDANSLIFGTVAQQIQDFLRLDTRILGYARLHSLSELDSIPHHPRIYRNKLFTMCQLVTQARVRGWVVGATNEGQGNGGPADDRCARKFGLLPVTEESIEKEARTIAKYWFSSTEDALAQQVHYPSLPASEAVVLAPLTLELFDPEVVLVYGNPAQIMMIMSAMQRIRYECFGFSFIGEGACADALGRCLVTGKPSLAIPCFGERSSGGVTDEEIVFAFLPQELPKVLSGLKALWEVDIRYPIRRRAAEMDLKEVYLERYPELLQNPSSGPAVDPEQPDLSGRGGNRK